MMPLRSLLVLMALLCAGSMWAQAGEDVVRLKNGAVYKGNISEFVPGESLTIVLLDGRVMKFTAEELSQVEEEQERIYLLPAKGFSHQTALGFQLGRSSNSNMLSFAFNMLNGYRQGKSVYSAGLGLETLLENIYFPLYAQYSRDFNITPGRSAVFVAGQAGYTFNAGIDPYQDYPYYSYRHYHGGYLLGSEVGLRHAIGPELAVTFAVGYRFYRMQGQGNQYVWPQQSYTVEHEALLHRIGFKLGVQFN